MRGAAAWLEEYYRDMGVYLWELETNLPARSFYERLGAVHAETKELEHPGGGSSASWRLVWAPSHRPATACRCAIEQD
jgi:hypothetical protein